MRRAMLAALLLWACASEPATTPSPTPSSATAPLVHVIDATVRLSGGGDAILSFAAHNAGAADDTLEQVTCRCADGAEIEGDATIGPEETALFTSKGPHVTLTGFDGAVGDSVDVTLTFANAGREVVTAEVTARQKT